MTHHTQAQAQALAGEIKRRLAAFEIPQTEQFAIALCLKELAALAQPQAEPVKLLPEREGQPDTLTMAAPHEAERGHWYSPAAVRKMLAAALAGKVAP